MALIGRIILSSLGLAREAKYFKNSYCSVNYCQFNEMALLWRHSGYTLLSGNSLRPRRNEQHFADDIFKHIFVNENVWISTKISLKFVPNSPNNNIPALVQIMAWRRSGDKPLSEPMMVSLLTHICVTRPQWVNVVVANSTPMVRKIWDVVMKSIPKLE